jgi:hypothetical protein
MNAELNEKGQAQNYGPTTSNGVIADVMLFQTSTNR